jgi:hypothetical protein
MVSLALGAVRGLIKAANLIPRVDISTTGLDNAIDAVKDLKDWAQLDYVSADSIKEDLGGIDAMLGLGKPAETVAPTETSSTTVTNNINVTVNKADNWDDILQQLNAQTGTQPVLK